jgi:N-acetylglucosamine kinase-like BadF-type ATPase
VDGGGTKTSGVLATLEGMVVATAETGSSNHYSNPIGTVRENLRNLIDKLRGAVEDPPAEIVAIGLGMAGVDRPEDHKLISGLVQEILPTSSILLDNDGVIALKGGSSTGTGIIVISGTGSIALGMNENGAMCSETRAADTALR